MIGPTPENETAHKKKQAQDINKSISKRKYIIHHFIKTTKGLDYQHQELAVKSIEFKTNNSAFISNWLKTCFLFFSCITCTKYKKNSNNKQMLT